jgi:hypothetical protein
MIMGPFVFGEEYTGLTFWFTFTFDWDGGVLVNTTNTLVTTVCYRIGVFFEVHLGLFKEFEVMGFTGSKVGTDNFLCLLMNR